MIKKPNILKVCTIEKNKIFATHLGEKVIQYLETIDPKLLNVEFTKQMEEHLDAICENKENKNHKLESEISYYHNSNVLK